MTITGSSTETSSNFNAGRLTSSSAIIIAMSYNCGSTSFVNQTSFNFIGSSLFSGRLNVFNPFIQCAAVTNILFPI